MRSRVISTAAVLGLFLCSAGLARAALLEVGSTVPDLSLPALGGGERTLSDRDAPTVLVFFRGVW